MPDIDHSSNPLENKLSQTIERYEAQLQGEPQEDFYDFCTTYQLEDDIQNNLFNQEFNQPHLQWIFIDPQTKKKTPAITNEILFAISTRIFNKSHIILFLLGSTNSGKSEFAQAIAKYYKNEFYRLLNLEIEFHIGFSDADLDDISPELGYGHLFIRDESGDISGEDSNLLKIRIGNLIRVIRAHQNSFIFVNPDIIQVPLVDYYIRMAGKKKVYYCPECDKEYINTRICPECGNIDLITVYSKCKIRAIVYYKQNDPLSNRESFIPLGRMYLTLHEDELFRRYYKEKKDKNIQYILQRSGLLGVHFNKERLTKEAQILANECRKKQTNTKIGMQLAMIEYNSQFNIDEASKMIGGTDKHNKLLYEKTAQLLESINNDFEDEPLEEEDTKSEPDDPYSHFKNYTFPYSEADIIKKAKQNATFRNVERDFDIYFKKINDGLIYEDMLRFYPDLTNLTSLSKVVEKVKGLINKVSGSLFEKEYVSHLQTLYKDKVIHDGRPGKPDAYVIVEDINELHVFSLKNISTMLITREEISPEQEFAFENRLNHKKVRLFIIANINNKIFVKEETDLGLTTDINFNLI